MHPKVLLITPPFTQLNTPYPATAYLKGFLNTKNISSTQSDLGIEVILAIFCKEGLHQLFQNIKIQTKQFSENAHRIFAIKDIYIHTIDSVISFLQGKNPLLAHSISERNFLPEASRFHQLAELDSSFGKMGLQDKAKHLATMYLEDISDFITECIDPHFGFSRYAEKLGRSANSFDELYSLLKEEPTYIDTILLNILTKQLEELKPTLVALSVPFPGNLYAAFRCAQFIKTHFPLIKIVMGGGFANTELRSLSDTRVFEFFDFITLDDGEAPLENLIAFIDNKNSVQELKRTYILIDSVVNYCNNKNIKDYKQGEVGTPDYSDLKLDTYISVLEIVNPMHRLWSDGRWNKLTMAHGCYWGKCTFCDISLDYIKLYEPVAASIICDRIETLIQQTGESGFHFVDEAAPPSLMREVALEILRRKINIIWWTNIRFEKSFTRDLCLLLKESGCIAVSGGLEVASDRLLQLIQKGITVAQVAKVTKHFTDAGIMVHAYLMFGFPTQTIQETIDSLEMVRQLFQQNILHSAFWHQFALTAHSPVGMNPDLFRIKKLSTDVGKFANNDIEFIDETKINHETFSFGLKKSLHNFMHGVHINDPLQNWFSFKIPKTTIPPNYISSIISEEAFQPIQFTSKIIFVGTLPTCKKIIIDKKNTPIEKIEIEFHTKTKSNKIQLSVSEGEWLEQMLPRLHYREIKIYTLQEIKTDYENKGLLDFDLFWLNKPIKYLWKFGLLQF